MARRYAMVKASAVMQQEEDQMTLVAPAPTPTTSEPVSPVKPSEALRLGRLTRPRHTPGSFLEGYDGACAVGAIAVGWGASEYDVLYHLDESALSRLHAFWTTGFEIIEIFDRAELAGRDGDAEVIRYLEAIDA